MFEYIDLRYIIPIKTENKMYRYKTFAFFLTYV